MSCPPAQQCARWPAPRRDAVSSRPALAVDTAAVDTALSAAGREGSGRRHRVPWEGPADSRGDGHSRHPMCAEGPDGPAPPLSVLGFFLCHRGRGD